MYETTKHIVEVCSDSWKTRLKGLGNLVSTSLVASSSLAGMNQMLVRLLHLRLQVVNWENLQEDLLST